MQLKTWTDKTEHKVVRRAAGGSGGCGEIGKICRLPRNIFHKKLNRWEQMFLFSKSKLLPQIYITLYVQTYVDTWQIITLFWEGFSLVFGAWLWGFVFVQQQEHQWGPILMLSDEALGAVSVADYPKDVCYASACKDIGESSMLPTLSHPWMSLRILRSFIQKYHQEFYSESSEVLQGSSKSHR